MSAPSAGRLRDVHALFVFTRVARLGSFSAAARECGLSQPRASRIVAELEATLGARLLLRTTRAVKLTDAGSELLGRADAILAALDDAEASLREDGELTGVVRVGMPSAFGLSVLLPALEPFVAAHPALRLELMLDDRFQDMVREAVDVSVRIGARPEGGSGTSRLLGRVPRVVVASPAYLKRHGTPKKPEDLAKHRIVVGPAAAPPSAWRFERNGETLAVTVGADVRINDTSGAVAAAVAGLGVTSTTAWSCERELASGALVELLKTWEMAAIPVHVVLAAGRAARRPARAFVEFLADLIHARSA